MADNNALMGPQLNIEDAKALAKVFSESDFVPDHYKKKEANCFIALYTAAKMKVDPLAFMQNTYVVHGSLGILGKMVIALINDRGPFSEPVDWKITGTVRDKTWKCTAFAPLKSTGEVREATIDWSMVEREGWNKNKKWETMTDQMGKYRSATFLARTACPEVLMGVPRPVDELEDIAAATQVTGGPLDSIADNLPESKPKRLKIVSGEGVSPRSPKPEAKAAEPEVVDPPTAPAPRPLTKEEVEATEDLLDQAGITARQQRAMLAKYGVKEIADLNDAQAMELGAELAKMLGGAVEGGLA